MLVNHVKEYLMFVHPSAVYSHFLSELQIAPIISIVGISVPNLVQGIPRTWYLLIWVRQLELQKKGYTTLFSFPSLKLYNHMLFMICVLSTSEPPGRRCAWVPRTYTTTRPSWLSSAGFAQQYGKLTIMTNDTH